jgi:hypothetical protein
MSGVAKGREMRTWKATNFCRMQAFARTNLLISAFLVNFEDFSVEDVID